MPTLYYIAVNGSQTGPFTYEEMRKKDIRRDTLVWTEGMDKWTKAELVESLKDLLRSTPPPVPVGATESSYRNQVPQSIPDVGTSGKYFGYELARRRERFFAVLIEAIIISIPVLIFFGGEFENEDPNSIESIISGALLSAILGAIFYPMWGGNLGHKIMGLVVISSEDGSIQKTAKAGAIRETLKSLFSCVIFPVIWLMWDKDKQNLYDKVINTYVVKKK